MNKLNFEFKRNSDCQTIKLDDLDKMVCEEFNLEYGNINNSSFASSLACYL